MAHIKEKQIIETNEETDIYSSSFAFSFVAKDTFAYMDTYIYKEVFSMNEEIMTKMLADYLVELSKKKQPLTAQEAKLVEELLVRTSDKKERERCESAEERIEKRRSRIEIARMGVDLITCLLPMFMFAALFQQGLSFEENGVVCSMTTKEIFKNMGKLIKIR